MAKKKILIGPHGMVKDIYRYFASLPAEELLEITKRTKHPSEVTIRWALRYQLNSPLAKSIRLVAREHFGAQPTLIDQVYED